MQHLAKAAEVASRIAGGLSQQTDHHRGGSSQTHKEHGNIELEIGSNKMPRSPGETSKNDSIANLKMVQHQQQLSVRWSYSGMSLVCSTLLSGFR